MGLFGKKKENETEIKPVQAFYTDCLKAFHDKAKKCGVANKGLIFIPELMPLGEKAVLAYLKDPFYSSQFSDNAAVYYYFIMSLSIQTGIVYASMWHENWQALQNSGAQRIIDEGPADSANALLKKHFPASISADQGNPFYQDMFEVWVAQHKPYWQLSDPRNYTFRLMVAAYQLGISMMLEKLGY